MTRTGEPRGGGVAGEGRRQLCSGIETSFTVKKGFAEMGLKRTLSIAKAPEEDEEEELDRFKVCMYVCIRRSSAAWCCLKSHYCCSSSFFRFVRVCVRLGAIYLRSWPVYQQIYPETPAACIAVILKLILSWGEEAPRDCFCQPIVVDRWPCIPFRDGRGWACPLPTAGAAALLIYVYLSQRGCLLLVKISSLDCHTKRWEPTSGKFTPVSLAPVRKTIQVLCMRSSFARFLLLGLSRSGTTPKQLTTPRFSLASRTKSPRCMILLYLVCRVRMSYEKYFLTWTARRLGTSTESR